MTDEDITMTMDMKIAQQFLKTMQGRGEGNTFNNIVIQKLSIGGGMTESLSKEELIFRLLEMLPEPRLDSLKRLVYSAVSEKLSNKTKAAEYLGVSARSIRMITNESQEEPK